MKNDSLPTRIFAATLILIVTLGGASAPAGEIWTPLKAPTLYYACFANGGKTYYASAVGAAPNPGPDKAAHLKRQADVQEQYKAWLTERNGNYGSIQCGIYESRVEATKWLADLKRSYTTVQWVDTGWKYSGGGSSAGSSAANAEAPAEPAKPVAGASAGSGNATGPFWACAASGDGTQYDSAIFSGVNLFPQQIFWEYRGYLSRKYNIGSMPNCESRPTHAEAEAFLAKHAAGTIPGATSVSTKRIPTGWIPHQLGGPALTDAVATPPAPPPAPKPQGPTSFYACKSNKESERTEYTSAAFLAGAGQGAAIGKAFNAYLIGMFGHEGVIECPQFSSLAKANEWINERRMFAIRNHSSIETTKWKPEGAFDETSVATTSAPQTPPPPKPIVPIAAPSHVDEPVGYQYGFCWALAGRPVDIVSPVFHGPRITVYQGGNSSFAYVTGEKFGRARELDCVYAPTAAEAEAKRRQLIDDAIKSWGPKGVYLLDWKPQAAPPPNPEPRPAAQSTPPASNAVTASATLKPASPAPAAARKGQFIVCNGEDLAAGKYFYNPPVEVTSGDYSAWMASYAKFLLTKYKYDRNVSCSKLPTLAEAQSYYKVTSESRLGAKDLMGKPATFVTTSWKYP